MTLTEVRECATKIADRAVKWELWAAKLEAAHPGPVKDSVNDELGRMLSDMDKFMNAMWVRAR